MHVLCAPDSFKETLGARAAAVAMAVGARRAGATAETCPLADGGEGTLDALLGTGGGERIETVEVSGPRPGITVRARLGIRADGIAVVELAEACGLGLVPAAERDPEGLTTFGVGEMIRDAARRGAREIIVAVGGSATVDGGAGALQALGTRFMDEAGAAIAAPIVAADLHRVARIEPPAVALPPLRIACDVRNPLLGPTGAVEVYGPQKGATTPATRARLEAGLSRMADLASFDAATPGAGAAGGIAFGLAAFAGARLERGADLVLDAVDFDTRAGGADLVLTGEGRLDATSLGGKVVGAVLDAATRRGVPVVVVAGSVSEDLPERDRAAFAEVRSLEDHAGPEDARRRAAEAIETVAEAAVRGARSR